MSKTQGVVVVYVVDDRVVAHSADFSGSKPMGFEQDEAQRIRAQHRLARAVLEEYCAPVVPNSMSDYDCDRVLQKMPGKVHSISIGYGDETE